MTKNSFQFVSSALSYFSRAIPLVLLTVVLLPVDLYSQSIAPSSRNTCIICDQESLLSAGKNNYAQFGDTSLNESNTLIFVDTLDFIQMVSGADHHLALSSGNEVYAWGYNQNGQTGEGSNNIKTPLHKVSGLSDIIEISCGDLNSFAVSASGQVFAWGANGSYQLGLGHNSNESLPQIIPNLVQVKDLVSGQNHSLALTYNGKVKAWGANQFGQSAAVSNQSIKTPQIIEELNDIQAIEAGMHHSLALQNDGTIMAWGKNSVGQLGLGHTNNSSTPTLISGLNNVIALASGAMHNLALDEEGKVWAWGLNHYGQLGAGGSTESSPIQVTGLDTSYIVEIFAGPYSSFALDSTGNLYAWGINDEGQLGLSNNNDQYSPAVVNLPCQTKIKDQVQCLADAQFSISDSLICIDDTLILNNQSLNTNSIAWKSNGNFVDTSSALSLSFGQAGTYIIDLIADPDGCADTSTKIIEVLGIPDASIYNIGGICELDSLVELFAHSDSGVWVGSGMNGAYFDPSIAGLGSHQIIFTALNAACTSVDTTTLTVNANPNPSIIGNPDLCSSVSQMLHAQGGSFYAWGNNTFGDSLNLIAHQDTSIVLSAVNAFGCLGVDTIMINVDSVPIVQFTAQISNDTVNFVNTSSGDQYYWDLGDGNNSVLENPEHIYLPGNYTVSLVGSNHCGADTLVQNIQIGTVTDIGGIDDMKVRIYPNPAREFVVIETSNRGRLQIVDALGKVVFDEQLNSDQTRLDLSAWAKGVYEVKVDNQNVKSIITQ
jgi:alpha-tubulin suppressor-like RCC1 family protein